MKSTTVSRSFVRCCSIGVPFFSNMTSTPEQTNFESTDNNVRGGGNTKIVIKIDKIWGKQRCIHKKNRTDRTVRSLISGRKESKGGWEIDVEGGRGREFEKIRENRCRMRTIECVAEGGGTYVIFYGENCRENKHCYVHHWLFSFFLSFYFYLKLVWRVLLKTNTLRNRHYIAKNGAKCSAIFLTGSKIFLNCT
jgi:hypothetical protein